ncbi:MFS transporter [Sulfurimonas sp. HSL-1716]|uniref:MFS transporter n=1 Tax=Hydrocurvibacter sulfurireducens TaxID=3131937 RepID=UPI0031F858E2
MHKIGRYTRLTLLLLSMTTMMSNVAIVTMLPHLKNHFTDVADIEFLSRMMITLPSLAIALLAPFIGHLVYKAGKYISAVAGLVLFSAAGSAGLYLQTIEELLISRFLLGIAIGILMIVTTSLIGDYFKGEARHKYMGIQSLFISMGGVFFVIGGGYLSDIDWRYPFGIYLIGIVLLPFAIRFLEETGAHKEEDEEVDLNANIFKIYLLAFALMLVFYILPTQMPFLIVNHFGASGTLTGAIIAIAFVSNGLGALTFARLKKHFSFAAVYITGMAIISVGFVLIGLVRDVRLFFFTSSIMGFGGGILMTNISAWMLSLVHHTKRVKSSGYLTSSLFLGQFFSPIVSHPVVSYFGVQHFFVVMGVSLGSIVLFAGIYKKLKER